MHQNDFLCAADLVHKGLFYSYLFFGRKEVPNQLLARCQKHGVFKISRWHHLNGTACQKCGFEKIARNQAYTLDRVIEDFQKVHYNKYDYSKVSYKNSYTKVEIICPFHGSFFQRPGLHKFGNGCPICATRNFYYGLPTFLYYVKIKNPKKNTVLYKIGVTRKRNFKNAETAVIKNRYGGNKNISLVVGRLFQNGQEAFEIEQKIIKENELIRIGQGEMLKGCSGWTETFFQKIPNISEYFGG